MAGGFSPTSPNGIRLKTDIVLERPTEPLGTQCICERDRVVVISVMAGGAAARSGIQAGDIIRNLGGYEVGTQEDMRRGRVVALTNNNIRIPVEILRLNKNVIDSSSPVRSSSATSAVSSPEKITSQLNALSSALNCGALTKEEYDAAVLRVNGFELSPVNSPQREEKSPSPSPPPQPVAKPLQESTEVEEVERDSRSRRHPNKDRVVPPPDPSLSPRPVQQSPPPVVQNTEVQLQDVDPAEEEAEIQQIISSENTTNEQVDQSGEQLPETKDVPPTAEQEIPILESEQQIEEPIEKSSIEIETEDPPAELPQETKPAEEEDQPVPSQDVPVPANQYYTPELLSRINNEITFHDTDSSGFISEELLLEILNIDNPEENDILKELIQHKNDSGAIEYKSFFDKVG